MKLASLICIAFAAGRTTSSVTQPFPVQVGKKGRLKRTTHCGMSIPYVPSRSVARRQTPYR